MPGVVSALNERFYRSLFDPIAADVAAAVPARARVLDAGCGRGQLTIRLAEVHGLDVTGVDVDPAEIDRARSSAGAKALAGRGQPEFLVADVARLPFDDGAFDLVTSTFSMHHWADPVAGLTELRRVLRPGGRALIWDLKQGFSLFHLRGPDPVVTARAAPLELAGVSAWRWPGRFSISRRLDLRRPAEDG
jgi:ubiquinone/menaquinone biosynthesis C-methylase UbiE